MTKIDSDFIWKLVIAGPGGVGKSCILHRYIHNEFIDDMKMTIGCQFHTQLLERQDLRINLVLWDFSGQERFQFIFDDYVRGTSGAFIMFDLSRPNTLMNLDKWLNLLYKSGKKDVPIVLVGGKVDLLDHDQLVKLNNQANQVVKENNLMAYIPTSSKTGFNVNETIMYMVDLLINQNVRT
ncbi:GTP-binding protein [Candidatus Bathyarchaeota archaeon]|nr:GTP-binding protein [Candidatus Bathyarchaeota archaeon]